MLTDGKKRSSHFSFAVDLVLDLSNIRALDVKFTANGCLRFKVDYRSYNDKEVRFTLMSVFNELIKNASLEILVENGKRHNIKSLDGHVSSLHSLL